MLHAGVGHGQEAEFEAVHGRALLQQWNGLFAEGAVVVDQGNFFAFEFVQAAFFFGDVLDQHVSGHPVGAGQGEVPLEDATVLRLTAAVASGDQGDLVGGDFLGQSEGDAGGQRLEHGGATVFAFEALVALHAAVGGVAGFAFFKRDLHAVDATTRIGQLDVVHEAVGPWHTVGCVGAGAVDQHGEKLLFGLRLNSGADQGRRQAGACNRRGQYQLTNLHVVSPTGDGKMNQRTNPINRPQGHQCGKGHNRNFCLAMLQSLAKP